MIAVDAMGGDYAPREAVLGALAAAKKGIPLILFGNQDKVLPLLVNHCPRWRSLPIEVVHCSDTISMEEDPLRAILRKKDSSIFCALQAVANKKASAFVSAGNSGAVVTAASALVGRVPGIIRPAIGSFLPTSAGFLFLLDLGANPDCRPEHLVQFAYMGYAYLRIKKEIAQPKIALLSNGHEPYKGSTLVKKTFDLLSDTNLEFIGNIESRDIFSGRADIVVTDGFTGNILLKGMQGTAKAITQCIKEEAARSIFSKILIRCAYPILKRMKKKMDYSQTGGALLLGVKQPVIIAHGSSKAYAITQAIVFAHQTVQEDIFSTFNTKLEAMLKDNVQISKIREQATTVDQVQP